MRGFGLLRTPAPGQAALPARMGRFKVAAARKEGKLGEAAELVKLEGTEWEVIFI